MKIYVIEIEQVELSEEVHLRYNVIGANLRDLRQTLKK